jgi:alpha-methylacyl-CoA racemase
MGPLEGYKVIEIAGVGPGQLAGMLLADMGASVVRIDRPFDADIGFNLDPRFDLMNRSREVVGVDLKSSGGASLVLDLCEDADAIFEGFRPGVMERLGLGPEACMARNPKLVYGRMTGWGQEGPLADAAGHDPNYIALAGVYGAIGEHGGDPVYPLNLIGDMGGGATYLVMGLLAALLEAGKSGKGQVVDAAMVDGAASLMTIMHGLLAAGEWSEERGTNVLDGGAPFVRAYRTKDDRHIAIAPIENRFFRSLLEKLGIDDIDPEDQFDRSKWAAIRQRLEAVFSSRTRDEWCDLLEGTDTCFAPVLGISESMDHRHNVARETFVTVDGVRQAAPAPRFSRTRSEISIPAGPASDDVVTVLRKWGASDKALSHFADQDGTEG